MAIEIFTLPDVHWMLIFTACAFMLLDIITGFVQAVVNSCVDSTIMKKGLWHKCGFLLAIIFGILCEYTMNFIDLGYTIPLQDAVCSFIIFTEIVSNLENLGKISPELSNSKFMDIFKNSNKGK